eukprot:CAMPEP_0172728044 /NCGR_PEP_ID=MMETSP1074-20121228/92021_1 /TAXON_ID=2916 /ORGANISM="Ceratium fusus, Strain PA161109" /LENGTH=138 /DNA_ID=CAMNT_0013555257 /DNA_START=1034 /DNA_END=1446 /DNA_ORIENTATION=+
MDSSSSEASQLSAEATVALSGPHASCVPSEGLLGALGSYPSGTSSEEAESPGSSVSSQRNSSTVGILDSRSRGVKASELLSVRLCSCGAAVPDAADRGPAAELRQRTSKDLPGGCGCRGATNGSIAGAIGVLGAHNCV